MASFNRLLSKTPMYERLRRSNDDTISNKSFDEGRETDHLHDGEEYDAAGPRRRQTSRSWTRWIIYGLGAMVLIETVALLRLSSRPRLKDPSLITYSPLNDVMDYKMVTLHGNLKSPYVRGKPADLDKKWLELYDFGMMGLTPSEQAKLTDPTPPTPQDPDTYPVMIQVFHNLHCLNNLRQAIWKDDYDRYNSLPTLPDGRVNRTTNAALHIDHCIEALREALMCGADITPISFHVRDFDQAVVPKLETTHACRDYDALKAYAETRQIDAWKLKTGSEFKPEAHDHGH